MLNSRLGSGRLRAFLGPTNTGKTHRALERMLAHPTGMIGLPLRLLAREVYDRLCERLGEERVALVTGEEKRLPRAPRYWVCTVESMPVERPVHFLAVDEVQLCAHPERGHVFTDRLLRARGLEETLFLGADTVEPVLRELLPGVEVERFPRLSRLSYAGPRRLAALPRRSAVVAFSAARVYELAEALKARHGGAAVVMGALSPRTRNAQVALYQSGEVPVMVATDAIGMGLNLDLDRVYFGELGKFDGRRHRPLRADELAQVAGRAGRFRRDGAFGPLAELGPLPAELVEAVEQHRFPPLRHLRWRNPEPDYRDLDALAASLDRPPPHPALRLLRGARDRETLERLRAEPELRALARGPERVALLWSLCRIPDYERDHGGDHPRLVTELFRALLRGPLPAERVERRLEALDRVDGEIEELTARIARVRTWTYVAWHPGWVEGAGACRERAREVEDRLSDALHQRLSQRFVDRRSTFLLRPEPELEREGERVLAGGLELGRLRGLRFVGERPASAAGERALRRALRPLLERRLEELLEAPREVLSLEGRELCWEGGALARLVAGPEPARPALRLLRLDPLGPGARLRLERRLRAWLVDEREALLAPLRRPASAELSPRGRGLLYELEQGLGFCWKRDAARGLSRQDRRLLARLDIRLGRRGAYLAGRFGPRWAALRAAFLGAWRGREIPALSAELVEGPAVEGLEPGELRALGYWPLNGWALRLDRLEELSARARAARRGGQPVEEALGPELGPGKARELARSLGLPGGREAPPSRGWRS